MNGVKITYILDENDRLTGEVTGNNTTVFLYDEGGLVYGFLYNDIPYFYLFNGQGDAVNVVDETGAVVASYNYDAWGVFGYRSTSAYTTIYMPTSPYWPNTGVFGYVGSSAYTSRY